MYRILVVDDGPEVARALCRVLRGTYEVQLGRVEMERLASRGFALLSCSYSAIGRTVLP